MVHKTFQAAAHFGPIKRAKNRTEEPKEMKNAAESVLCWYSSALISPHWCFYIEFELNELKINLSRWWRTIQLLFDISALSYRNVRRTAKIDGN